MPSEELKKAVSSYEQFIKTNGISEGIIKAYLQAVKVAVETEKESKYGLYISARVKQVIWGMLERKIEKVLEVAK